MKIRYKKLLAIWLNHTSTAVLLGRRGAGGQAHVAFGQSRSALQRFFRGAKVRKHGEEWSVPLEPYGDLKSTLVRVHENAPKLLRAGECRLAAQGRWSPQRYGLWERCVVNIPPGASPLQAIIFFRTVQDRFHARVLGLDELQRLPASARPVLLSERDGTARLVEVAGEARDRRCPPSAPIGGRKGGDRRASAGA
jgi:hypothetical protein